MSRSTPHAGPAPGTAGPTVSVGTATPAGGPGSTPVHGFAHADEPRAAGTNLAQPSAMALPLAHPSPPVTPPALPLTMLAPRLDTGWRPARSPRREAPRPGADLEAAQREIDAFGAAVSHDLRAPLRQIAGFTELLAREAGPALNDTARQYLADISDATAHMTTLIEALLAFSRAGQASLRTTTVDLDALAHEAVRQASRDAPDRAIDWAIAPLPTVPGDAVLLGQVFRNLLANAVKYTRPRRGARIEIGTSPGDGAGEVIVFVRDNGVGFDMRYAGRLFGMFERLHPASEFEGTGVGLASVRRIVERHGGRVWAEAEVGAGATFHVALPDGPPAPSRVFPNAGAPA